MPHSPRSVSSRGLEVDVADTVTATVEPERLMRPWAEYRVGQGIALRVLRVGQGAIEGRELPGRAHELW